MALGNLYAKYDASVVSFEVAILSGKGGHAHVQIVPIPNRISHEVESAFVEEGRNLGITFESDPDEAIANCAESKGSYFRVDMPMGRKLVHIIKQSTPFSIQFGR